MAEQSVGQISMDLVLNSKGFKKQLTSSVNDAVKSAGNSCTSSISSMFGKLGAVAAAAFSVKALLDFGKSAIELGSNLAEVQNVVDVAFEEMSGAADEFAKSALKNFGLSETSAKKYMGTFGAMSSSFGYTNKEALEMAKTLTGLTGDVASFYNMSSQEAYTKLKSVFTGETESLKELGVVMTQAALDQFALNNGFGKTTKSMTEQEKVALRLAFVTKNLEKASGDFLRTEDSWANQTRILTESWNAFKAQIGQALIQVLTPLIKYLNTILERLIQIGSAFNQFTAKIFGKQELKGANEASQDLSSNIGGIGEATEKTAKEIKKSLMGFDELNTLADNTSAGEDISAGGIDLGLEDINADEGNAELDKTNEKMQNLLNRAKELKDIFKEGFNATFNTTGWEKATEHSKNIVKNLKELANDKDIQNAGNNFADKFSYNLGRVTGSIGTVTGNVVDNFVAGWDIALESHKDTIKQTALDVFTFEGIKSDLIGDASQAIAEISNVLNSEGAEKISGACDGILLDISLYGTQLYERLSTDILNMLVKPLEDNKDTIIKDIQDILDALEPAFTKTEEFTEKGLQNAVDTYDSKMHPAIQEITQFFSNIYGFITEVLDLFINKYLNQITSWFTDFVDNHLLPLWTDLQDLGAEILDFLSVLGAVFEPIIKIVIGLIMAVVSVILDVLLPVIEQIINVVTDIIDAIILLIKGAIEFLSGIITGDFRKAIEGLIDIVGGVMKTVAGIVDGVLNTIVDAINNLFGTTFGKSNLVSWVTNLVSSLVGKVSGNKNADKSGIPGHTPKLASGGYVAANTPQLAIIGDNKHEGEIVAPESKIAEAVASGISSVLNGMNLNNQNNSNVNDIVIPIILDGNELDRVVVTAEQRRFARNGGR